MLPLVVLAVGGYLVYDSVKKPVKYADGGKIDMQTLGVDLKSIKNKYPNAKVSWSLAKDSSGKGYVITAKEGSKIVYSSYKMADGGMMTNDGEGIDLFEDNQKIPSNLQKVLDKHKDKLGGYARLNGSYEGFAEALKDVEEIGYTFDVSLSRYSDLQAYDLRPIGTKGKSEARGGTIRPIKPIEKMTKLELMKFVQKIDPLKNFYPETTMAGRVQAKRIYEQYLERKSKMADGGMTGVSIKGTGISAAELIKIISNPKVESILVPSGILGYVIVDKKAMIDKLYKLSNGSVRLVFDYDMAKDMNWIYIDTKKELNS